MVRIFACGVDEYRAMGNLSFCVNDSIAFCNAFAENLIVDKENICIATDDGNISNTDYCKKLKTFCDNAKEEDIIVVFHSGHGGIDENEDSYLLMSNSFNEQTNVYTDQILAFLGKSKARTKLVILDCCHSDVGEKFIPAIDLITVIEKFYAAGITIFSSCKKTEESRSENGYMSVFTEFLCNALYDKHLLRDGVLYFNDFQNLVSIYAANYNRKHPDEMQTPIMRTSMIGTVVFQARNYIEKKNLRMKYLYRGTEFDLLDMTADSKIGNENKYRKFVTVRVVMKNILEIQNVEAVINSIVMKIEELDIPINSWKRKMVKGHPIEIINMTIHNDYIDYEANLHCCHITWTLHEDRKWHRGKPNKSSYKGEYSYQFNSSYEYLKKMRIEYTFTDDELISFWKKQTDVVIRKTSQFDRIYHAYRAGDISVLSLCEQAKKLYSELGKVYNECDDGCFPTPFSEYQEFNDKSLNLIGNARSLVFVCAFHKEEDTEQHLKDCLELELAKYYRSLKEWNDILPI